MPVTYLEPDTEQNRSTLGYNMLCRPGPARGDDRGREHRAAQRERQGRPETAGPGAGIRFCDFHAGVRDGARWRAAQGFVYSAFNARDFLASALLIASRGELGIRLYDESRGEDRLMAAIDPDDAEGLSVEKG